MNFFTTTSAISIGTFFTTRYALNYVANKATEKATEKALHISKKVVNIAFEHLVTHENEEKIDFVEFEMIELDPNDRSIIKIINVIELTPDLITRND